ncbi:MAG TPA: ABC transporter ATP-binding protein [Dehalococcoidia bacterium]|nr:ABC transporter ATP-binding protein [Dehalococcoidia bacterium]
MQEEPGLEAAASVQTAASETHGAHAVQAIDLSLDYGDRRALDGISLNVPQGDIFGLLGPNGSGKTTLVSLFLGLLEPTSGQALVLGRPPAPDVRQTIGVLFQESCLDPNMTVAETLELHGEMFGLRPPLLRMRLEDLLARFGLAERQRDATRTLSGGLKRRLELARALVPSPQLLFLDEPTTGLDPEGRADLWEHLHRINQDGTTIVVATHDMLDADRHSRRVAFINQGRLTALGSPEELKRELKHDSVRLEWPTLTPALLAELSRIQGVGRATWLPPLLHVTVDSARDFVPRVFQLAGDGIRSLQIQESTLEDAYFQMVGRGDEAT